MIEFRCKNCNQKIRAQDKLSGKRVKCPNCGDIVIVPKAENAEPVASQNNFSDSKVSARYSDLDPALFDIPQKGEAANRLSGERTAFEKGLEELKKLTEKTAAEEGEQIGERKLPCFIDIFLYPMSFSGVLNLAIFIGVPLLIDFLWTILPIELGCLFQLVSSVIKGVVVLYMYWYFVECISSSADGGLRAPKVLGKFPHVVDMFFQMVNVIGCFVVFFAPFVLYVLFAKRADVIFWMLLAYAVFVYPMALLAIVVIDSVSALKPRLLYNSISNTFLPYFGLILIFVAGVSLIGVLGQRMGGLEYLPFPLRCAGIYLAFVAAHLLGRFYWRYQEKLNWEV
jgi:DNA-directed RNA polymerase subunit RPC12/RpoP